MSLIRLIASREFRSYCRTCFAHCLAIAYLVLTGTLWIYSLYAHEGEVLSPTALWAQLHASCLPLLAIFSTLKSFSVERSQGTLDNLLTSPAPVADVVAGKYAAALMLTLGILALSALGPLVVLPNVVSSTSAETSVLSLLAGVIVLALQAALWTALGIFLSILCRSQALTAAIALMLAGAIPFALRFFTVGYMMPLVYPHYIALDATHGTFALFPIVCYVALTPMFLFLGARALDFHYFRTR